PWATISHGFQRHDQAFHDASGPPWIHSRSGAGASADAWAGSVSQARTARPSATVASTSRTLPGTVVVGTGDGSAAAATGVRSAGAPEATKAARSRRTGSAGAAIVVRRAYTLPPSGLTATSENTASSAVTRSTVA